MAEAEVNPELSTPMEIMLIIIIMILLLGGLFFFSKYLFGF